VHLILIADSDASPAGQCSRAMRWRRSAGQPTNPGPAWVRPAGAANGLSGWQTSRVENKGFWAHILKMEKTIALAVVSMIVVFVGVYALTTLKDGKGRK
jgi:hypothetical protein